MRMLLAIYSPPEHYPPLINAVSELAAFADEVIVITRNIKVKSWNYPSNVRVVRVGAEKSMEDTLTMGQFKKAVQFISFVKALKRENKNKKTDVWQANDSIPLFAYFLLLLIGIKKPGIFWYHNHDVSELSMYRKYSIGWWAAVYEKKAMALVDFFTIPAKDRFANFDLTRNRAIQMVIPNYPSLKKFQEYRTPQKISDNKIKLIYQGSLGEHHGFEELIPCLGTIESGIAIYLTLIGPIDQTYKQKLLSLAEKHSVVDFFQILPPVPYDELGNITREHHVGLAIHKPVGQIYNSGGTASNKIYEYAANGLPIILHDNKHYREYLERYNWAFFTDCSCSSFHQAIAKIYESYPELSHNARIDFERSLNFETAFLAVPDFLKKEIGKVVST